ncbi:MAG TPA: lamin tail domain-containing protein, partial [Gemmatimonadales bacterium]|nr:lamin tail domain-containing protein [Gemmatimonadales bacterium]
MRSAPVRLTLTALIGAGLLSCTEAPTAPETAGTPTGLEATAASATHLVISQVYGGGGNSGATLKNDFIELLNASGDTVTMAGWSVQYASSGGSSWQVTPLTGSIPPGGYYLVQEAAGSGGTVAL